MKAKGFLVDYYEQDIRIDNGSSYAPATRAEFEEMREKALEELKELRGNVFTFVWQYGKEPKGMETAMPKLYFRDKEEPLYGETEN